MHQSLSRANAPLEKFVDREANEDIRCGSAVGYGLWIIGLSAGMLQGLTHPTDVGAGE